MRGKLDQKKARKLWVNVFIKGIVPNQLTDAPEMREFLAYASPNFKVPSRRTLTRDINKVLVNSTLYVMCTVLLSDNRLVHWDVLQYTVQYGTVLYSS